MVDIAEIIFSVIDVETTGLSCKEGDRVCEIAAIKLKGQNRIGSFQSLINPKREISPEAFQRNKITQDMLKGAPFFEEIAPSLYGFIRGSVFVAQKAYFDLDFINSEFARCGYPHLRGDVIDTISLGKYLFPGKQHYNLDSLMEIFDVGKVERHRSMGDVEATAEVFVRCVRKLNEKGIKDISRLLEIGRPVR
jgi:DNA polymerase III epsilon subunit